MKQITFEYEGKEYTLCYTRMSVKKMEQNGFSATEAEHHQMTAIYDLFAGALLAKHGNLTKSTVEKMFDRQGDLADLANDLMAMYKDVFTTTQNSEGEIKRTKNW